MVFSLRVTLSGIKGFYRVYQVNGATTLYTLHKQLRSDLEFPQDQLIMFKGLDVTGGVVGRWGLFDLGAGTVDQMPLEKAVKAGVDTFVYFYDVTNKKSVNIVVEGEADVKVNPDFPVLADSKGPNPIEFENGYVAFEDLPERQRHLPGEEDDEDLDDEDMDEEEGDEEDEDGKEIFDEGEE
ncbi:MAG: hypothetical protein IJ753_02350 [Bacteroidales bacterium]|nr:hypothetical protein [Bacteroidales bacterium]MBQ9702647.1 hypothetical protein [Bacteroidales bacterium]MBR1782344.1 hypothetical protein [Bacteroidales bacterium]